jgi:hypothetical protein
VATVIWRKGGATNENCARGGCDKRELRGSRRRTSKFSIVVVVRATIVVAAADDGGRSHQQPEGEEHA